MKRQWKVHRQEQAYPDGQRRWDRAYLLVLEITRSIETDQRQTSQEEQHASSNLCTGIDPAPGPSANH